MDRPDPSDKLTTSTKTDWFSAAGTPAPWPGNFPQNWRHETHHNNPKPEQPPLQATDRRITRLHHIQGLDFRSNQSPR